MDKNHNPRKGTETATYKMLTHQQKYDKNHNPRKGTETNSSKIFFVIFFLLDKNHNPRKGTETCVSHGIHPF